MGLDNVDLWKLRITATEVAYAKICSRKLWLFSKGITFESENDWVLLGKLLDKTSFKRNKKEENPTEGLPIKMDFVTTKEGLIIHEVKHSSKLEEAHFWQVKYYIWFLRRLNLKVVKGILHYPKEMKMQEVSLSKEEEREIENLLKEIERIKKLNKPPKVERKPYCKNCAYYKFCFV